MKKTKQINFFTKKNPNFWIFFIPLLIIVLLSLGVLIATSWYSIDYKIAQELAKGLTIEFAKYWTRFYEMLGTTELFIIIIIYLSIMLETWFLKRIEQKNKKFAKNYWIVDTYYIVIFIIWVGTNLGNIILTINTDSGFGKGIDHVLFDDLRYKLTGMIAAFIFQTILLSLGLYYVKYQLVNKKRLLKEQFWLKAIKVLVFIISTYIIIIILKGTTSRLYYYNAIFGDLIKSLPSEMQQAYQNSGFKYGYNLNGSGWIENIPWELQYPWWKSSLPLVQSNSAMPRLSMPWDYAFPSGHINATYCTGSGILLFFKTHNNEKVNWKIKVLFALWIAHILSMNFALVVERFHWISDTAFTFIFSALMAVIINFSINKIFAKKIK